MQNQKQFQNFNILVYIKRALAIFLDESALTVDEKCVVHIWEALHVCLCVSCAGSR